MIYQAFFNDNIIISEDILQRFELVIFWMKCFFWVMFPLAVIYLIDLMPFNSEEEKQKS